MQAVLCKTCEKESVAGFGGERILAPWGILKFIVEVHSNSLCTSCAAHERLEEIKVHFNHDNRWYGERLGTWIITAKRRGTVTDYTIHWEGYFDASVERRQALACYMEELGILSRGSSGNWQVMDENRGTIINPKPFMSRLYFTRRDDVYGFIQAYNEMSHGNSAYSQKLA